MAAGLGFKDFVTGEVLTAADVDGYLMQGIWVFASAAARSAAVTSPQEGNYSYLKDTNSTEYYTGSAWVSAAGAAGATYAVFRDEKSSGTNGGTFTSGAWRTRDLNTSQYNGITGASLASNQITLAAGTYIVDGFAQGVLTSIHQTRFENITDSTTAVIGQNAYAEGSSNVANYSRVSGVFTIAAQKTFEFQHRATSTKTDNGFGVASSWGTEVYASITITKVA